MESADELRHPLAAGPLGRFLGRSSWTLVGRLDRSGRVVAANPALRAHLGRDGAPLYEALLPDGVAVWDAALRAIEAGRVEQEVVLDFAPGASTAAASYRCLIAQDDAGDLWLVGERRADGPDPVAVEMMAIHGDLTRLAHRLARKARALERARADLEALSRTDPLTGLGNRRQADLWLASADDETPRACLMLDLDHFKEINDQHGHPTGDRVLEQVGRVLREILRPADRAARYGGDEFLILCDRDEPEAAALAERIRGSLAETVVPPLGSGIATSLGVAGRRPGEPPSSLLARADAALVQAKRRGRRRVAVAADDARIA